MSKPFTAAEIAQIRKAHYSGATEVRLKDRTIRLDQKMLERLDRQAREFEEHGISGRPRVQLLTMR